MSGRRVGLTVYAMQARISLRRNVFAINLMEGFAPKRRLMIIVLKERVVVLTTMLYGPLIPHLLMRHSM